MIDDQNPFLIFYNQLEITEFFLLKNSMDQYKNVVYNILLYILKALYVEKYEQSIVKNYVPMHILYIFVFIHFLLDLRDDHSDFYEISCLNKQSWQNSKLMLHNIYYGFL